MIEAAPDHVWPWVVQIGRGRGGFYTYMWLENLIGADIRNLDRIDTDLQHLAPGDRIWHTPDPYLYKIPGQFWQVARVTPGQSLLLRQQPPDNPSSALWSLEVLPLPGDRTRLVSRTRGEASRTFGQRLGNVFWTAGNSLMVRGMLRGIKQRAEATAVPPVPAGATLVVNRALMPADPEAVFAVLSDLQRELEWNEQLLAVEPLTEGPVRPGSRYRVRFGRGVGEALITYDEVQPPVRWRTHSTSRHLNVQFTGSITATASGSAVVLRTVLAPAGPLRLVRPALAPIMARSWDRHLRAIAVHLQATPR